VHQSVDHKLVVVQGISLQYILLDCIFEHFVLIDSAAVMKDDEEDDASGNGHIAEQHDHSNTNADNTSFHPTYAENDQFDNAYTGDDGGFIDNTHFENNSLDQQPLSAVKHSAILPSDIR